MIHRRLVKDGTRRRGAVAVLVLVMMSTIIGFAALTIDVGMMYNTRADLQRSADAAALAAASSLVTDSMMVVRGGNDDGTELANVSNLMDARAASFAGMNASFGTNSTLIDAGDVRIGWLNLNSAAATLVPNPAPPLYPNAIEVTVRRTHGGSNGAVGLMFASVFGPDETEIVATATAVFDDRVGGITSEGGAIVPFTVHEDVYNNDIVNGGDQFSFDDGTGTVNSVADGIPEINLYPHNVAPGNFGLLNIPGSSPPNTPDLRNQIDNGVAPEDIQLDIGGTEFVFEDDFGNPLTYGLSGNPGFKATLESNVDARVGDVVAFFLHDGASGSGNNLDYNITGIRFGRVMGVQLNGPPAGKGLWIQPAIYSGPSVRIVLGAPSAGTMGRVVLAR